MARLECRDIFEAVYYNVKGIILASLDSVKVKSRTVSESATEDENGSKCTLDNPVTQTTVSEVKSSESSTETVRESVERESGSAVEGRIRLDLQERFPYAMAAVCAVLSQLDKEYRLWRGYDEQGEISGISVPLSEYFPLSDRFASAATLYISSLFLIGVDDGASEKLFGKYTDAVAHISAEIPWECKATARKYRFW